MCATRLTPHVHFAGPSPGERSGAGERAPEHRPTALAQKARAMRRIAAKVAKKRGDRRGPDQQHVQDYITTSKVGWIDVLDHLPASGFSRHCIGLRVLPPHVASVR